MEMTTAGYPLGGMAAYDAAQGWARRDAAHLLRRSRVGASHADIEQAFGDGPTRAIERLLAEQEESAEFLARDAALERVAKDSGNSADLRAWWAHRLLDSANPLVEKMTLFLHGHFATSNAKVQSIEPMAAQNALFRHHALGSFRELLHAIARDVAMLAWLDGNANRRRQPNENFARELMELFALGVGNYTEQDIREAARAFSGWHVRDGQFWFNHIQHDIGDKTVFGRTGNFDGNDIVDLCLEQKAAARFLADRLLQFFVMPQPPDSAVDELATCIRENDYAMRPVLRTMLSSAMFFGSQARRAIIKSPADFVLGTTRTLEARPNLRESAELMAQLGQALFEPPTVEGWKGGRAWINSATMLGRANFAAELTMGSRFGQIADPAQTAARLGWHEPHEAVDYYIELLLARDVPIARPAVENYLQHASGPLGERLRGVLHLLLTLPEYQLV
jgi:uncharacterized protein (DUF1800 family)